MVGGGPSGYATAIALSKQGFKNIIIFERARSSSFFDPTMGFVYNISAPGRAALSEIGMDNVQDLGAPRPLLPIHVMKPGIPHRHMARCSLWPASTCNLGISEKQSG